MSGYSFALLLALLLGIGIAVGFVLGACWAFDQMQRRRWW